MTTPHAEDTALWVEWISKACDPKVYFDIGAGDGHDCQQVAKAFPECACWAVEPYEAFVPGNGFGRLRDVVGAKNGYTLYHIKDRPGVHGMYSRTCLPDVEVTAKPVRTLAHICDRENIPSIDAMKIDVEGAAYDVLVGAKDLLAKVSAVHIETEWVELFEGQRLEEDVFILLAQAGLTVVHSHRVESLGQGDSIWVRR